MNRDAKILALVVVVIVAIRVGIPSLPPIQIGDTAMVIVSTPWWLTVANVAAFVLVVLAARRHVRRLQI
jgi:hypothetical protein